METVTDNDIYQFYNPKQSGRGIEDLAFYRGNWRRQKGAGLGGILGSIGRRLLPLARRFLLPSAKKAAKNIALDILSGKNVKESLKDRSKTAIKEVGHQIIDQIGSGRRKKLKKPLKRTKLGIQLSSYNGHPKKRNSTSKRNRRLF